MLLPDDVEVERQRPSALIFRAIAEIMALTALTATVLIIARAVGPDTFGHFALAITLFQGGQVVLGLGLATAGANSVTSSRIRPGESWLFIATVRAGLVVLGVTLAQVAISVAVSDPSLATILRVAVLGWLSLPLRSEWALMASGSLGALALVRVASTVLGAVAAVVAVATGAGVSVLGAVIITPPFVAAALSSSILISRGHVAGLGWPEQRARSSLLRDARQYVKGDISGYIFASSDRWFLYALAGPVALGFYEAAYRVIQPFYAISSVLGDAFFRELAIAKTLGNIAPTYERYIDAMLLGTVPVGYALTLFSPWVIQILYGPAFDVAIPQLAILGWVITVGYLAGILAQPLPAWSRARGFGNALFAGNLTNIVGNVVLIPSMGGIGAAAATVLAQAAVALMALRTVRTETDYPVLQRYARYSGAALLATLVGGLAVSVVGTWPAMISFAVVYALTLVAWRGGPAKSAYIKALRGPRQGRP